MFAFIYPVNEIIALRSMLGAGAHIRRPMTMGAVFGRSEFCKTRSV
jgi:hypothetical protein